VGEKVAEAAMRAVDTSKIDLETDPRRSGAYRGHLCRGVGDFFFAMVVEPLAKRVEFKGALLLSVVERRIPCEDMVEP